jgi:hypothetical protein
MCLFGKIGVTGRTASVIFALMLLLSVSACHSEDTPGISAPETVPSENEQVDDSDGRGDVSEEGEPNEALPRISEEKRSIIYILPSETDDDVFEEYQKEYYLLIYARKDLATERPNDGERTYAEVIRDDFRVISQKYNTVILVISANDSTEYFNNLTLVNSIAAEFGLNMFYAIFPKGLYGAGHEYLDIGSRKHQLLVEDFEFLGGLSQTWKVGLWYGWNARPNRPTEILTFRESLPLEVRDLYSVWLDEEWYHDVEPIADLLPEDLLVVVEWYSRDGMAELSTIFKTQMIVTGDYAGVQGGNVDRTPERWLERILIKRELMEGKNLYLGIWIFVDSKNDSHGEGLTAYFPESDVILPDPWAELE